MTVTYGKSNGNGPLHLMVETPTGLVANCGVERVHVVTGMDYQPKCTRCASAKSHEARAISSKDLAALEAEFAHVGTVLTSMNNARENLRAALYRVRLTLLRLRKRDPALYGLMRAARDAGMTLQQIADLFGITRQAVSQRLLAGRRSASEAPKLPLNTADVFRLITDKGGDTP